MIPGFTWDPQQHITILAISKSFSEIPEIAEWIKTRPETKY